MLTQCTCAFSLASLSQRKVQWAKSISTPCAKRGFQRFATAPPWQMELVETKETAHNVVQEVATHLRKAGHPPGRPLFVVTPAKSYASLSPQSGITA